MSDRYVLAFVGENAYGILRWWTEKIMESFGKHGLSYHLIDMMETGWESRLTECLVRGKPEFCFSFQGLGMDLRLTNGESIWTRNAIPFFSYLGDNPYHAPRLHSADGPGMYLLYGCIDFFETYRTFLNGRAYASTLPCGYPENPLADRIPWSQRKHPIVYLKTAVDAEAIRRSWDSLPKKIRSVMHDASAQVLSGRDETVATICAESFADQRIHWGHRHEIFFSVCSTVDRYARAVRAERMIRALLPHNALIVGDWSHLNLPPARARFISPLKADCLDELYADSKIVVNTSPTVRFGIHERVVAGLFANAAVVSDSTPFMQKRLENCPSFLGIDIDKATFPEQLDWAFASVFADPALPEKLHISANTARELFSFEDFVQQLLDYVEMEQFRKAVGGWGFQPFSTQSTRPAAA